MIRVSQPPQALNLLWFQQVPLALAVFERLIVVFLWACLIQTQILWWWFIEERSVGDQTDVHQLLLELLFVHSFIIVLTVLLLGLVNQLCVLLFKLLPPVDVEAGQGAGVHHHVLVLSPLLPHHHPRLLHGLAQLDLGRSEVRNLDSQLDMLGLDTKLVVTRGRTHVVWMLSCLVSETDWSETITWLIVLTSVAAGHLTTLTLTLLLSLMNHWYPSNRACCSVVLLCRLISDFVTHYRGGGRGGGHENSSHLTVYLLYNNMLLSGISS